MDRILNRLRTVVLSFITLTLMISQFNLLGSVYAKEHEKIRKQNSYGELYDQDIHSNMMTSPADVQTGNPDIITKEPVIEARDTSHENDIELEEKRTENTKTYKIRTGEYITEYYFEPIHKKDKNEYKEIENNLEKSESLFKSYPSYKNKDGLYDFSVENGTLNIKNPNKEEISILPQGKLTNYAVKENVILYSEVEKNLDLEYRVNSQFIQQNIYINGDLENYSYSFEIKRNDYTLIEDENGSLLFTKDDKEVYTLLAPYLIDKDGNRNQNVSYSYNQEENGNTEITVSFDATWIQEEERVFPVIAKANVAVRAVEVLDLNSSYIRSGRPNIQSQYSDLFVGYDNDYYGGANSNIKIARTFIYFAMPNIGKDQRIEKASLKLYKEQDLAAANELNDIDVYNSNYVNPSTVTWNTQPNGSTKQFISNNKFSKPKGWKNFDITKHVQDLNKGQKKTLILQTSDESSKYNCNVFNSESTGRLPKVEINHCDDYDINLDLDINQFDNELRVYAKDGQYFEGISMDGIAKPNSTIKLDLYAKVNDTNFNKVSTHTAKGETSRYFIDPVYITNPIVGTQTYKKDDVNYTTDYFKMGKIPKYDTFYEYRMKVSYNDKDSSKELVTDGFIIYKVKLGDNLKTIASHYGLKVEDIKKDNNTKTNKVIEGDVIFLRFSKNNPKVPKDVYRPPIKISSYEAKYVYRGPSCYGSCSVADPVNTSIGNFYHESTDFTLTDFDELSMERVYNSYGEDNASMFGINFSSNFEQYISYDKDDHMLFFRGDGKIVKINKSNGQYKPRSMFLLKGIKFLFMTKEVNILIFLMNMEY